MGQGSTALVNAVDALVKSSVPFMPNTLVVGGGGSGSGVLEGLAALLMRKLDGAAAPDGSAAAELPPKAGPGVA